MYKKRKNMFRKTNEQMGKGANKKHEKPPQQP